MAFDLPHSDDCFVQAFPAETTEAFLEGHVRAFAYFGGVPTRILYDNTKLAVARILGDGERQKTRAFSELQSHYLFAEKFGRPAKGNDKGKVENLVGYARRNFMVPIPRAASWEELNAQSGSAIAGRAAQRRLRGHSGDHRRTLRARPRGDAAAAGCALRSLREDHGAGQLALAGSLPHQRLLGARPQYGHRQVLVKGYVHRVVIACGSEVIADTSAAMNARPRSTIRCITWRCSNTRAGLWIRPRRWPAGSCRSASPTAPAAGGATARSTPAASTSRCLRLLETFALEEVTARRRRRAAPGHHQLRRGATSAAVPHRAPAAAAGHGQLAASAAGPGAHHAGRRLHGLLSLPDG